MLILKEGYPEKSELLVCTVTKIQFNSIFVSINDYVGKSGIIHISEISPGRIRNIRDYVKEEKVIVCVVLRVNRDRDLIELSLRRVQEGQRRNKINEMKQEQKAAKLIEFVAKKEKEDAKKLTDQVLDAIIEDYDTVHSFFEEIVVNTVKIDKLGLSQKISKTLEETIRQRIKPPEVIIKGEFKILSYEQNGIEIIKKTLKQVKEIGKDQLTIIYKGAGKYGISIISEDYKTAEKLLNQIKELAEKDSKKNNSECTFKRTDK